MVWRLTTGVQVLARAPRAYPRIAGRVTVSCNGILGLRVSWFSSLRDSKSVLTEALNVALHGSDNLGTSKLIEVALEVFIEALGLALRKRREGRADTFGLSTQELQDCPWNRVGSECTECA